MEIGGEEAACPNIPENERPPPPTENEELPLTAENKDLLLLPLSEEPPINTQHEDEELANKLAAEESNGTYLRSHLTTEEHNVGISVQHQIEHMGATVFYEKVLTSSDTSGSGRVIIPKAIAEKYMPHLESPAGRHVTVIDTLGNTYNFRYRFWTNNQSRMYLLEGAAELHTAYNMQVGDTMVFAQREADGQLVMAGKPGCQFPKAAELPVIAGPPVDSRKRPPQSLLERRVAQRTFDLPTHDPGIPADGIFRAVVGAPSLWPMGVCPAPGGRWCVCIVLAGEVYSAMYDSREDAQQAYRVAGNVLGQGGTF